MHKDTGELKKFESKEKLKLAVDTDRWIEIDKMPSPNCPKCYGRGHRGLNITTNEFIPCKCTNERHRTENIHQK